MKVVDDQTLSVLKRLVEDYATGPYSYRSLATHLNRLGLRNRLGGFLTKAAVEGVVNNRFYSGVVVWHPGKPDEEFHEGTHAVPPDIQELWKRCQIVRRRNTNRAPASVRKRRVYPLTGGLSVCDECEADFHGQPHKERDGTFTRRLEHNRESLCGVSPRSHPAEAFERQLADGVLDHFLMPADWKAIVMRALAEGDEVDYDEARRARLDRALGNLRNQHLWGDITNEEYRATRDSLQVELRKLEVLRPKPESGRAAEILSDMHGLWTHLGVTNSERQDLAHCVFEQIRIRGHRIVSVSPRDRYLPLFAMSELASSSRSGREDLNLRPHRPERCALPD